MSDSYERTLLIRLLEIHDLNQKRLPDDYDAVRRIRRQQASTYEEVREYLNRPVPRPATVASESPSTEVAAKPRRASRR